jgi:threonyl-tRNA synthetase
MEEMKKPEKERKYVGDPADWEKAEKGIEEVALEKGLNIVVVEGEAAFYGPKLDFMVKDALGRKWQLGTVQVDYQLPKRFELEYIGSDNQRHCPVMIHRAPFGSMERFIAVLTEHCAGNFPLWLAPEQVAILPISEKFHDYAHEVQALLEERDIRGYIDERSEKVQRKIRDAEVKKIPFMLIIGEKEQTDRTVSVRKHGAGADEGSISLDAFIQRFEGEAKVTS